MWPCSICSETLSTAWSASKRLLEPWTSIARVTADWLHVDRQAGHQLGRPGGQRLDHEHQPVAAVAAEDHRRGELGPRADIADPGGEAGRAAVAGEAHGSAGAVAGDLLLGDEEADLDAVVGEQADHRLVGGDPFAGPVEDVFDPGSRGAGGAS